MFILLNSWATKNPCLNRGFNFTLVTFLQKFSTALSVGVRDTQQCWVTAAAVTGRWALESLGGPPGRGAYTPTEKATSFVKIMPLSWVCCDSHQNSTGDMSELLPLHLSSAAKVTASSCPRVSRAWLIWGKPLHPGDTKESDACDKDLACQTLRGCSCGQCYLLGLQLSYWTFL